MFLPIEILQQIFVQRCLPDKPTYFPPGRNEPRLVLAHVSSQWRAVAFAMPELWNNIVIDQPPIRDDSSCLHNLLPIWLSNSSPSTLSLHFTSTKAGGCSLILNRFIFPVIHRCSELTLEIENVSFSQLLSLPSGSFASLQAITIHVLSDSDTEYSIDRQLMTAFHSSLNLRHVALEFYAERFNIAHFNLPWHQLFTLTIKWCTVPADIFLDVLRECASLRSCHIILSPIDHDALQRIRPLSGNPVVSSLHTLTVKFSVSAHHSHFLAAICLPHLRKCKISCPHGLPWSTLRLFIQPLSQMLEDLTLKDLSSGYECMDEILTLLSHLTRLYLFGGSDPPLAALSRLSEGITASHLTELSLGYINAGLLLDLLEGRVAAAARAVDGGVAAFRSILAHSDFPEEDEAEKRLAALRATGMKIVIIFPCWLD